MYKIPELIDGSVSIAYLVLENKHIKRGGTEHYVYEILRYAQDDKAVGEDNR